MTIAGRRFWLWRAVDDEGEILDLLVQRRRDKAAAAKLMLKLLKNQGFAPGALVTDKLRSYGAAKSEIGLSARLGSDPIWRSSVLKIIFEGNAIAVYSVSTT
ncbi:MAG: DDE-type integrase/transposase/recombinase [Hyphomicrobiales bacterium]|nr:DDE-type integrase/transposase/recombinase [Hyphomicrobiales bacterium]MBV8440043.1 DDE-type integrase/transposase/recombinase [Hyphomicrobiales bacterium]